MARCVHIESKFITRKSHTGCKKIVRLLFLLCSAQVVDWKFMDKKYFHFPNVFQSAVTENLLCVRHEVLGMSEWEQIPALNHVSPSLLVTQFIQHEGHNELQNLSVVCSNQFCVELYWSVFNKNASAANSAT